MKLIKVKDGVKQNKENTVKIIDDISKSKLLDESLYKTKVRVCSQEFIESADCIKVIAESGERAYIRTELFGFAKIMTNEFYITTEYPEAPLLIGLCGKKCVLVAPLVTKSVEMYL